MNGIIFHRILYVVYAQLEVFRCFNTDITALYTKMRNFYDHVFQYQPSWEAFVLHMLEYCWYHASKELQEI